MADKKENINTDGNTEKYLISIIGEQILDGDSDRVEVLTAGNYIMKNGRSYIGYREYDEENQGVCYNNLIKVENDTVTISRRGPEKSQLILEKSKRHQCLYQTMAGNLMIGIFTKTLCSKLSEKGGTLEVSYTLDFNSDLVSENSFKIKIEENSSSVNEVE
ncbi:MAG: DUF1934 domain-containing protein [Clostridiales bacterium]|nr:DUF1934 domain-containing protein [Clostridiales bacterium]